MQVGGAHCSLRAAECLRRRDGVAVVMVIVTVGGFVTSYLQHGVSLNQENVPGHCLYLHGIQVYWQFVDMVCHLYVPKTYPISKSQSSVLLHSQHGLAMFPCRHDAIGFITFICCLSTALRILRINFYRKHKYLQRIARKTSWPPPSSGGAS